MSQSLFRPISNIRLPFFFVAGLCFGLSLAWAQDAREKVGPDQTVRTEPDDTIRIHTHHTPEPTSAPSTTAITPEDVQALNDDLNKSGPSPSPAPVSSPTPTPDQPVDLKPGPDGLPAMATLTQFQADVETDVHGTKAASHIAVDGGMVRSEIAVMGMQTVVIVDQKNQKFTQMLPDQKLLVHIPWSDDLGKMFDSSGLGKGSWVLQPKGETVNGILCEVWKVTEASGEIDDVDLDAKTGQPVKIASEDGSYTVYWKNFKPGPVPSDSFTIPTDYKEMDLPPGMKLPSMPTGPVF